MHPILELAAVLHPMPEPGTVTPDECFDDARDQVDRQRKDYADNLEATALGTDGDPLILAIEEARKQKAEADQRIRRLLAYALKFQPARRYPLHELARASGYTNSGVRTAYTDEEIKLVQGQIGRDPRDAAPREDPS
jgi:hypothetical protein